MESCEVLRAGTNGALVVDGSRLNAKLCNISGTLAGSNLLVRNGASADVHAGTLTNAVGASSHNIHAQNGANIDAGSVTATGAGDRGCKAEAATVNLVGANVSGSGGAADLFVQNGAVVQFNSATGTTGATLNTPAASGLVFG
jgi:hypothetical protein